VLQSAIQDFSDAVERMCGNRLTVVTEKDKASTTLILELIVGEGAKKLLPDNQDLETEGYILDINEPCSVIAGLTEDGVISCS